jgi:ABC-type transporter Mla subunit MlaD
LQISTNLTNALNTYGSSSAQYQTVLEILKDFLRRIDRVQNQVAQNLDSDTLTVAMGFLEIGK